MKYFSIEKMKNVSLAALLMASAMFAACSNSDDEILNEQPANPTEPQTYTMTIQATKGGGDAQTRGLVLNGKTLNTKWNANEFVYVLQYQTETYSWNMIGMLKAAASDDAQTTLTGNVSPSASDEALRFVLHIKDYASYTGQTGVLLKSQGNNSIEEKYDFATCDVSADDMTIDTEAKTVSIPASISLQSAQAIVKFTLEDEEGNPVNAKKLTIKENTGSYGGWICQEYDLTTYNATYGGLTITPASATDVIYAAIKDVNTKASSESAYTLTAEDADGNVYTYTKSGLTFAAGKYYDVRVKMKRYHEAVDLGLSVKWATMNVGATSVTDPGKYFAWGATTPGTSFTWSDSPYYSGDGTSHSWVKYTILEATLEATDDAATQNWGSNWRMPTYAEWNELVNNCTCEWVTNYQGSEVSGALLTSTKENYTDKSIFLPASGYYDVTKKGLQDNGRVYYWIPLLYPDIDRCLYIDFTDGSYGIQNKDRANGLPIRPVMP